jgi:predicted nucleic acid-binding protein
VSKKVIISDTNIIIYLGVGAVFEKFCLEFEVGITEDVAAEINNGRASRTEAKNIFYEQYQQGRVTIVHLTETQKQMRDELMGPKTKIGLGESSSIAVVYEESDYVFATNDIKAIEVAIDLLSPEQVVNCGDILEVMAKKKLLSKAELEMVKGMMDG